MNLYSICKKGNLKAVKKAIKKEESYCPNPIIDWHAGLAGACEGENMDIINFMIEKGGKAWNWGLSCACIKGNIKIIDLMIEKGAHGWDSALAGACQGGHLDIANLMISKGANNWDFGLSGACRGGHIDMINFMIKKGADSWDWALKSACEERKIDIVKLMLEKGGKFFRSGSDLMPYEISYLLNNKINLNKLISEGNRDYNESKSHFNNQKKQRDDVILEISILNSYMIQDLVKLLEEYIGYESYQIYF